MQDGGIVPSEAPDTRTIPDLLRFSARGFADEVSAHELIQKLHSILSVLSNHIDISNVDGVTVAYDYDEALAELDRGYETSHKLAATKDVAVGVGMAPSVLRDGVVKTHLVINAGVLQSILEEPGQETDCFGQSLHLIAHECAHVEVTAAFDKAFPGVLLRKTHNNVLDGIRWQVALSAWDEYAACRIVGSIGSDPTKDYLEVLLKVLATTRAGCLDSIREYRLHGNTEQVVVNVYGRLGDLLKFASYFVGTIASSERSRKYIAELVEAEEFHWFSPFYNRLIDVQSEIWEQFGRWKTQESFEKLGDILEDIAESVGVSAKRISADETWFDIPYRWEAMPFRVS